MVDSIRNIEKALGTGEKKPQKSEVDISKVVTKRCVAARTIKTGDSFSEENICVKRNDKGLPAKYWDLIIGKQASKDYEVDEAVEL